MSDDLISRQAAIALAKDICVPTKDGIIYRHRCIDPGDIAELPSVEPDRKKGHWIDTDNYYQRWKCSECGCHTRDAEPNYCPHCGADMRIHHECDLISQEDAIKIFSERAESL